MHYHSVTLRVTTDHNLPVQIILGLGVLGPQLGQLSLVVLLLVLVRHFHALQSVRQLLESSILIFECVRP